MIPNPRVSDTGSPPIPEAKAWLAAYDGRHGPAIDLSQAVPGHPPPDAFLARLAEAAGSAEGARYGAICGDAALRAAYAEDLARIYGADIAAGDVAITAGCNLAFVVAAMTLAKAGDAVVLPAPWYFNHEMTLRMLGIAPRALPCRPERGFVPDPADLAPLLADGRVRALVLVTPNNPTGAVYPPDTIAAFAELARGHGIALVLDETYRDFLPPDVGRPHDVLAAPSWREHVVQLYSFSKAYAMPGHRVGALLADPAVIGGVTKVLDSLQICAARPGQMALAWGIAALCDWREANRHEIAARAEAFRAALANAPGWRIGSIGAYFAYLRHPMPGRSGRAVAEALARDHGVLALPGSYFGPGQDDHLRFAFANADRATIGGLGPRLRALGTAQL